MEVDTPERLKSVAGGKIEKQRGKRAPRMKYRSSTVVSETVPDFKYQQAQSRRWLELRFPKANRGGITKSTLRELNSFFHCGTVKQLEVLPQLTAASTAVVRGLEAERARASALQGGIANPKDWFVSVAEESSLVSLMGKAALTDNKEAEKEQRKLRKRRFRQQKKEQHKLREEEIAQAGGPEAFEAAALMEGLQIEKDQAKCTINKQGAVLKVTGRAGQKPRQKKKNGENRQGKRIRAFLEKKAREAREEEAAAFFDNDRVGVKAEAEIVQEQLEKV